MDVFICLLLFLALVAKYSDSCDPKNCLSKVHNIFQRPADSYALTLEEVEILCGREFKGLLECWQQQCGPVLTVNRAMADLILQSQKTITQICLNPEAKRKLVDATSRCRIFYPSDRAPPAPAFVDGTCRRVKREARNYVPPMVEETDSGWIWPSVEEQAQSSNPYDLSGSPIIRPVFTAGGEDWPWQGQVGDLPVQSSWSSNWFWPGASIGIQRPQVSLGGPQVGAPPGQNLVTFPTEAVSFPSFPMLFPSIPPPGQCLEINNIMDCTLSRSCVPDLGQVLKPLALMYLGCNSAVPVSAVCDITRVAYCMRLSGGTVFDVFEPSRSRLYCQNYEAIISCMNRDCPANAAATGDQQSLDKYKKFLRNFCTDLSYQSSVIKGSVNCPLLQNVTALPGDVASMACAQEMLSRQLLDRGSLCNVVEANMYCLAFTRRCEPAAVSPQISALLEMVGCPARAVSYDLPFRNSAATQNQSRPAFGIAVLIMMITRILNH